VAVAVVVVELLLVVVAEKDEPCPLGVLLVMGEEEEVWLELDFGVDLVGSLSSP